MLESYISGKFTSKCGMEATLSNKNNFHQEYCFSDISATSIFR